MPPQQLALQTVCGVTFLGLHSFGTLLISDHWIITVAMKLFGPKMHGYYSTTMLALLESDAELKLNFLNSVFGCAIFNLGPQVATVPHIDNFNMPASWCVITALGDYDVKEGSQILLWDLMLMIEFPPGSLILLPSAMLCYSNMTVHQGECQYSFMQYSAGGLFQWAECGFMTQAAFLVSGKSYLVSGEGHWAQGMEMFSTWEKLCADANSSV